MKMKKTILSLETLSRHWKHLSSKGQTNLIGGFYIYYEFQDYSLDGPQFAKPIIELICRYLQKDKVNGPEGNTLFYELAERALDEAIGKKIKEYISQVLFGE